MEQEPSYFQLDRICAYCAYYTFKDRIEPGGWAYCRKWQKWFPDQKTGKPAGERSCKNWKQKGVKCGK